jgi:hypothetical protein
MRLAANIKLFIGFFIVFIVSNGSMKAQSCLNYSTFFGTVQFDEIKGVCSDPQSNIYVLGNTYNTDLPVTAGAFQSTLKGSYESFIAKFDSCGNLIWCSYFGTSGFDNAEKITYSNDNTIVFCGHTDGTDLDTTSACFQPTNNGSTDCYLAKFSLAGAPIWITYFGSTGGDFCYDIKTDSLNNIVIGGTSISPTLYTTTSSFQQFMAGSTDAFIARFNSNGNLKFSTFYGGSGPEDIHALTIDKSFNIIGVGGSFSINLNTSPGCFQSASNGGMEVYVLKLDSSGQRVFSTYIGGAGTDDGWGVCTDNQNYIYVSGHTNSGSFYTSPGAFQPTKSMGNDGYCLSFSPTGIMLWSTFIGGTSHDFMTRMHLNQNKELVLLLSSQSTNFPMLGLGSNTVNAGSADAVVMKFLTNGTPFWSGYIGGSATETPRDIISINKNKVVVVGNTSSADHPVFGNSYQNTFGGTEDGYITFLSVETSSLASVNEIGEKPCSNSVFYNSTNKEIVINKICQENFVYQLYDVVGKFILESSDNERIINLSDLSRGIYILQSTNLSMGFQSRMKFLKD